jgi:hypothetical protein
MLRGILAFQCVFVPRETAKPQKLIMGFEDSIPLCVRYEPYRSQIYLALDRFARRESDYIVGGVFHVIHVGIWRIRRAVSELQFRLRSEYLSGRIPVIPSHQHAESHTPSHIYFNWKYLRFSDAAGRDEQPRTTGGYGGLRAQKRSIGVFYDGTGLLSDSLESAEGRKQSDPGCDYQNPSREGFWPESLYQIGFCLLAGAFPLFYGCRISLYRDGGRWGVLACLFNISGLGLFLITMIACNENQQQADDDHCSHGNTVTHKCSLTRLNYCNTLIGIGDKPMANVLDKDKQIAAISALAENPKKPGM